MRRMPVMQWVCASGVEGAAQAAARLFEGAHGLAVQLRPLDEAQALLAASIDCEAQWRRGERPRVDSPLEHWLRAGAGAVLVLTDGARAEAEALRAFVPAGQPFLSLCGPESQQPDLIAGAAWRLAQADAARWLGVAVD
ncbi:hypothetical protein [uncultured Pseudacidovorax sp.]|uniref:hypothetical protein n=1 Tax=uncultured Pseudacidovorax sp. TaxID=679313 RepID=UPI0025D64C68|nr:hypothetical protein [uncultured Pseudacidovorax sp.]